MAQEVTLLGVKGSPFSCRVQIALDLKGIGFKYSEEDLQNKSDKLIKHNPVYKKVPVLVHNGNPLAESLVIIEYIDETWKGFPISPADPYLRTQARFWSKFMDEKCFPAMRKAAWTLDKEEREKAIEEAFEILQFLETELSAKFFGGDNLGIVDIAGDIIAFWFPVVQEVVGLQLLTPQNLPKLWQWTQDFINDPLVKRSLPPREVLLAAFRARFESFTGLK